MKMLLQYYKINIFMKLELLINTEAEYLALLYMRFSSLVVSLQYLLKRAFLYSIHKFFIT